MPIKPAIAGYAEELRAIRRDPPVVNDPAASERARRAAESVVGGTA